MSELGEKVMFQEPNWPNLDNRLYQRSIMQDENWLRAQEN